MFLNLTNLIVAIIIVLSSIEVANAKETIFKCVRADGSTIYSENKCKSNEKYIQSKDMEALNELNNVKTEESDDEITNKNNKYPARKKITTKNKNLDKETIDNNIYNNTIPPLPPLPEMPFISEISRSKHP